MDTDGVNETFDLLVAEVEALVDDMRDVAAEVVRLGELDEGKRAIEDTERVKAFIERVRELQNTWREEMRPLVGRYLPEDRILEREPAWSASTQSESEGERLAEGHGPSAVVRQSRKRPIPRGGLTPVEAYRRPLLEALLERGGAAPAREVIRRVGEKLADRFNEYDRLPMPSNPREARWEVRVRQARQELVRHGLMKKDSPRGVWEITEVGRHWLESSWPSGTTVPRKAPSVGSERTEITIGPKPSDTAWKRFAARIGDPKTLLSEEFGAFIDDAPDVREDAPDVRDDASDTGTLAAGPDSSVESSGSQKADGGGADDQRAIWRGGL